MCSGIARRHRKAAHAVVLFACLGKLALYSGNGEDGDGSGMSGRECAACAKASPDIFACARTIYERRQLPRHATTRVFLTIAQGVCKQFTLSHSLIHAVVVRTRACLSECRISRIEGCGFPHRRGTGAGFDSSKIARSGRQRLLSPGPQPTAIGEPATCQCLSTRCCR